MRMFQTVRQTGCSDPSGRGGSNIPANEMLNHCLIPAMSEVGQRYESGDFYIPEMLLSARAMKGGLEIIKPHLLSKVFRIPARC